MPCSSERFRGFLPVVLDVETGGFNAKTDALLEIAACVLHMDDFGRLGIAETISADVEPFEGAVVDPRSLEFTGIDLDSETAVPRAYRLPYQKVLHRKVDDTMRKQQQGERFVGSPVSGGGQRQTRIEFEAVQRDTQSHKSVQ